MNPRKIWIMKRVHLLLLLMPALALAMPAFAQVIAVPVLSDSQEKGSLIVFPKFVRGTVVLPEGGTAPRTEIEVQVDCPVAFTCAEHQSVKIRFHWVCPSSEADQAGSFVCRETDFDVTATVFEKIVFTPDGGPTSPSGLPNKVVPVAPCPRGYLIGWVIRPTDDAAIKFDALTGDAVLRASGTAVAAYPAIPVQAHPLLANMAVIAFNGQPLPIDGLPGHYTGVTGRVIGDIRYPNNSTGPTFTAAAITLLTLDVRSNRPNNPVFVDLDVFGGNPSVFGNENQLSTFTEFTCWIQERVDVMIDENLNQGLMGRKGTWESGPAIKLSINGIPDNSGPVTLLGLVEITEGRAPGVVDREYITVLSNDSILVPTLFFPEPSPIPPPIVVGTITGG
jgi:hypothetical protein